MGNLRAFIVKRVVLANLLIVGFLPSQSALAHEGETHAEPASVPMSMVGSEMVSVSGRGESFEVVLKYKPFEQGSDVSLAAFVVDGTTNEPVRGATIAGTLSEASNSHEVRFAEIADGVPGSYRATVKVSERDHMSWLFDIAAGDRTDLVAVDGFEANSEVAIPDRHAQLQQNQPFVQLTRTQTVLAAFVALVISTVLVILARRNVSAAQGRQS